MELQPHPRFASVLAAFGYLIQAPTPWSGIVFRSVSPRHAAAGDVTSGRGSLAVGGRWNPRGSIAAVHASLDPETALAESLAHFRRVGLPDHLALPRVFVALDARLERTIDLSRSDFARRLRVTKKTMVECDWRGERNLGAEALTQAIGRAAFLTGFDGILVPSAGCPGGVNLVAMPENFGGGSCVTPSGA
jgi:RES domain-containing protein